MGVVNVTPDSFSDGGDYVDCASAVAHARELIAQGADIIDVGGESTRPGSTGVAVETELARVVPVIEGIRSMNPLVTISIDTSKSEVARQALIAGASMVNDVTGGRADDAIFDVVASAGAPFVVMHMRGQPRTMQDDPAYVDVVNEVASFLLDRVNVARKRGVSQVFVDPGIGFGKTVDHNIELLRNLERFDAIGDGILLGISRKRFLGAITGITDAKDRDAVTALAHSLLLHKPVSIIRVHNVSHIVQLRSLVQALC